MSYTNGLDKPEDYFNTVTYVANQTDNRQITVGFQPDFTWLKDRDQAVNHDLYDAVRGATKYISSNKTNSEATQTDGLKSFNSTGFTLGTGWGNQTTGDDYVSWNWLASNTTASNTDGSITSTVSANTTSGFSIVSWSGNATASTIGHSLGTAPSMIIAKNRNDATNWFVGHTSLGWTKYIVLNSTGAEVTDTVWNDTAPTSSVFSVGTFNSINGSGDDMIAYCFAEKKGFSKFGSYTGNGSTDGTFVYTGFKPAWIMIKQTNTTGDWMVLDNKRDSDNGVRHQIYANTSGAESVEGSDRLDFLSNGIKHRSTGSRANGSGGTYIYMAFAENPFVTSTGVPTTAR
jgi:hypothetical protein